MARGLRIAFRIVSLLFIVIAVLAFSRMGGTTVVTAPEGDAAYITDALPLEFSIVTYNVQGRPWFDDTRKSFPEIGARMNAFDIVAYQECFKDHRVLWEPSVHPAKAYHNRLRDPLRIVGSGLSTVARFPLVTHKAEVFRTAAEVQNKVASKGMLLTRFDIGGHTVDVYNTHMEAGSSPEANESRRAQGQQLIDFVARNSPAAHTVIFVGDFNMSPYREGVNYRDYTPRHFGSTEDMQARTAVFDRIRAELVLTDVSEELEGPVHDDIDRVLYRVGDGVTLSPISWEHNRDDFLFDDGRRLSDHDPVIVRFRLEAR